MNILIIDDNKIDKLMLVKVAKDIFKDISIDEAENGKQALELVNNKHYDLVVSDIVLGIMEDGYEVCQQIQKIRPTKVLFVTGSFSAVSIRVAKSVGAIGIIEKEAVLSKYRQKILEILG